MPKLSKDIAKQVENAELSEIGPLEEGRYTARLREVRKEEGKKAPYLVWEFDEIHGANDAQKYPGRQWLNTSLSEAALWKVKETFHAFGVTADTDTDDLLGKRVGMVVTRKVIEGGKRQGEIGNNIERLYALDGLVGAAAPDDEADDDEDDLF